MDNGRISYQKMYNFTLNLNKEHEVFTKIDTYFFDDNVEYITMFKPNHECVVNS